MLKVSECLSQSQWSMTRSISFQIKHLSQAICKALEHGCPLSFTEVAKSNILCGKTHSSIQRMMHTSMIMVYTIGIPTQRMMHTSIIMVYTIGIPVLKCTPCPCSYQLPQAMFLGGLSKLLLRREARQSLHRWDWRLDNVLVRTTTTFKGMNILLRTNSKKRNNPLLLTLEIKMTQ